MKRTSNPKSAKASLPRPKPPVSVPALRQVQGGALAADEPDDLASGIDPLGYRGIQHNETLVRDDGRLR